MQRQERARSSDSAGFVRIRGARVHNLQNLSVDIPRDAITVVTGVSGSGKSSLAFDTLFAEGQRQYIDSLSTYARQYLDAIPRPDVDLIDGLAPTLSIDQKSGTRTARSTVGTVTEIYDYLRLLYARVGTPHCTECGSTISTQTPDAIVASLAALPVGTKLTLMSPMVRDRKGGHRDVLDKIAQQGLVRVRVDGEIYRLEDVPKLAVRRNHTIEAVVDRIVLKESSVARLDESVRLALRLTDGLCSAVIHSGDGTEEARLMSTAMACIECGASFETLEPRTFSFNSPHGACPTCNGLGTVSTASKKQRAAGRRGKNAQNGTRKTGRRSTSSAEKGDTVVTCQQCGGARLRPEALAVTIDGLSIDRCCAMPLPEAADWMRRLDQSLSARDRQVADPIRGEVIRRVDYLRRVGVDYLTLDRTAESLSGGELQRVRLATCIGSGLVGVCYVLDEPSIGLHPADHGRLLGVIEELKSAGNTIVIVEHDEETMRIADHVLDIGPGAGRHGGQLVSQGDVEQVTADPASPTGQYLAGKRRVGLDRPRRPPQSKSDWLTLSGATLHNLSDVTVAVPLGLLVGVSGVSGSGKSSLIVDTLAPALAQKLGTPAPPPGPFAKLRGADKIDKLVHIDQSPIGRTSRSCPATYAGVMDPIRTVFAKTRQARTLGFTAARFSFNSPAGRCELCKGNGFERVEMNFLSDLLIECSRCAGKRFNRQTLQVRFKGATIADVLDMTIETAAGFFEAVPKVHRHLQSLLDVGLGYVSLGQSSTTLSGGEAQRIKLATELARPATGRTLYLLDEPTTGLHFSDVQMLLEVLDRLVASGNTVVVIEHHVDLLNACDWLIDMGPKGGVEGGEIVAAGPPEVIRADPNSQTGRFLENHFS